MSVRTLQLRRLFRVVNGGTPSADSENWGGDITWVTPADLGRNTEPFITSSERTLTGHGLSSAANLVPQRSIVLSTRAPIGHTAIADRELAFNQGCKALVARVSVDERFFRYQLLARREELRALGQGATFPELSGAALSALPLMVPPLRQQRLIAELLNQSASAVRAAIDRGRCVLSAYEEHIAAKRLAAFEGLGPESRLKWAVKSISQGSSPPAIDRPAEPGEWAVVKLSAIKRGTFHPMEQKALPDGPSGGTTLPGLGDLLVTRSNTPKLVGDCCVVGVATDCVTLPDLIYRVRLDEGRVAPRYVMHYLLSPRGRAQLEAAARGTSQSMVKLRGSDILDVRLPVPSVPAQQRVAESLDYAVESFELLSEAVTTLSARLQERHHALITAATTGQIDRSSYRAPAIPA